MPIPNPTPIEKKNKDGQNIFMERCMHALKDEKRPQDQKVAICMSTYRRAKERKKSKGDNSEPTWEEQETEKAIILN